MSLKFKNYSDTVVGKDGCLYKATLLESTPNVVNGLGLGVDGADWVTTAANYNFDPVTGATKNTGTDVDNLKLRFDIPAAIQTKLASNMYIQIKVRLAELVNTVLTGNVANFFRVDTNFILRANYFAVSNYNRRVTDMDGNRVFGNAVSLNFSSQLSENINHTRPKGYIHSQTPTDENGFIILGVSMTGSKITLLINGIPTHEGWRGFNTVYGLPAAATYIDIQNNLILPTKELLVYDRPLPDINSGPIRILGCAHSFWGIREALLFSDANGEVGTFGPDDVGAVDTCISKMHELLDFDFNLRAFGTGSENMSNFYTDFIVTGASNPYIKGPGNYLGGVDRFLPHFCIIFGPFYNGGYTGGTAGFTSRKDAIYQINTKLTSLGCIPIYILEQNGDAANTTPADFTAAHAEVMTELLRWRTAGNDVGIVDGWTDMGGSTVDRSLVEGPDLNSIHPNDKAKSRYGALLADEVNRLYRSPPAYAQLSSFDAAPVTIAAP